MKTEVSTPFFMLNFMKKTKRFQMVGSPRIELGTPTVSRQRAQSQGMRRGKAQTLSPHRKYVIPAGFSLIPAIDWVDGRPSLFHILCEDENAGREKGVETKRRTKGGR